ncbi:MAG: class I SAM-dependent methyltransferase [Candidatus Omnitrophica bacterium]|nr:class I SAM-dependent methyltransferase [Candidatus Omnitrophota bacterium]
MVIEKVNTVYQKDYARLYCPAMYDAKKRLIKADKTISVLNDYFSQCNIAYDGFSVLDIGCSSGFITYRLGEFFKKAVGIDIDQEACCYAQAQASNQKTQFVLADAMRLSFADESFDVVVCSHIYEHVPASEGLLHEIFRVLKQGGVCYFAGPNKLNLIEPHYKLPLLSLMPKRLAHVVLRLTKGHERYHENLRFYWGLKRLCKDFEVVDYTGTVVRDPQKYSLQELLPASSIKARCARFLLSRAVWLSPTFIWILKKTKK